LSTSFINWRILIVANSATIRSALKKSLHEIEGVSAVDIASDPALGVKRIEHNPVQMVLLATNFSDEESKPLKKALGSGKLVHLVHAGCPTPASTSASESILQINDDSPTPTLKKQLESLLKSVPGFSWQLRQAKAGQPQPPIQTRDETSVSPQRWYKIDLRVFRAAAILVASSTGGPDALKNLFSAIKGRTPRVPIFIVQHMPPAFTASLARQIGELTGIPAAEGVNGQLVQPGRIYVAPGDWHMSVQLVEDKPIIRLDKTALIQSVRPAANPLMQSGAQIWGNKTLGFVLSGMGEDGKDGAIAIKNAGGVVGIQDQSSSVVWGMPGSVFECGAYDLMGTPDQLGAWMQEQV
jgi:two-component system chemotaxis response regulator CheB